jgi:hypothetical protein
MEPRTVSAADLDRECEAFTRAIAGTPPSAYVKDRYRHAHSLPGLRGSGETIDRSLVRIGRMHPLLARLADAYAGRFVRQGLFRTKLALVLGLLESSPPHFRRYESVPTSRVVSYAAIMGTAAIEVLALVTGTVVFGPVHLWARVRRPPARNG